MKKISGKKIFIIPFAGGSVFSMTGLAPLLNGMEAYTLELPGRGKRIREDLITDLDVIVDDLYKRIEPLKKECLEYYIYGHSMGTLLGYLLIQKIVRNGEYAPSHFFVSGRGGPSAEKKRTDSHLLPSDQFKEMLRDLGGCPEEVLNDEELMDFFEPVLRADFEAVESYEYKNTTLLDIPITGFFGSDEETTREDMYLWQKESSRPVEIFEYPGNHFFIYDYWGEIAQKINTSVHAI